MTLPKIRLLYNRGFMPCSTCTAVAEVKENIQGTSSKVLPSVLIIFSEGSHLFNAFEPFFVLTGT